MVCFVRLALHRPGQTNRSLRRAQQRELTFGRKQEFYNRQFLFETTYNFFQVLLCFLILDLVREVPLYPEQHPHRTVDLLLADVFPGLLHTEFHHLDELPLLLQPAARSRPVHRLHLNIEQSLQPTRGPHARRETEDWINQRYKIQNKDPQQQFN